MSVLQIRRTIPYNARKIQAVKEVEREGMEKAFPPVLSDFNFIVVSGCGPVENASHLRVSEVESPTVAKLFRHNRQADGADYPIPARESF